MTNDDENMDILPIICTILIKDARVKEKKGQSPHEVAFSQLSVLADLIGYLICSSSKKEYRQDVLDVAISLIVESIKKGNIDDV